MGAVDSTLFGLRRLEGSVNYELELPKRKRIYPTYYILLLGLATTDATLQEDSPDGYEFRNQDTMSRIPPVTSESDVSDSLWNDEKGATICRTRGALIPSTEHGSRGKQAALLHAASSVAAVYNNNLTPP